MKILVVPSWYPPNGGRFFKLQAESLAKLGHDVDVLILEEKGISQKENTKIDASKSVLINEIRHSYLRIPKMNSLNVSLFIKKYRRLLLAYLKENKPDVIHAHSAIWAGVVVSEIAKENGIPYVITEHRSLFFEKELAFSNSKTRAIKFAFDKASDVIAVSSAMRYAIKRYTLQNVSVIPNMVDTSFFKYQDSESKSDLFVFLSVGNLIEVKGVDILLSAFAGIHRKNKNVLLKIVGEGANLEKLKKQAKDLEITRAVVFCGYKTRDELREIFSESSAFVSSSRHETFGLSIVEALCCGLPIVVTKSGGPEDIVNETNGYLAESKNANSLQSKMQLMIDNSSNFDRRLISQAAQQNYSEIIVSQALEKQLKDASTKID